MALSDATRDRTRAAKSSHVSDPALQPFLQQTFDAADFLNKTLPGLAVSQSSKAPESASLTELSSQTQTLLSQLNAQATRLSTVLTQLTDDILRCGGRLAYEVEVLRGETIGLSESLSGGLQRDIRKFVPDEPSASAPQEDDGASVIPSARMPSRTENPDMPLADGTPPFMAHLRTLSQVRSRLESVIKIFGEAMQWTLPPSEVSLAPSLISVSAPESGADVQSREDKGREFAEKLRNEIVDLITGVTVSNSEESGYDAATARTQALRDLARVWKGTSEERARIKFVESLAKLAEDRQRALERDAGTSHRQAQSSGKSPRKRSASRAGTQQRSHGFLDNLQRIRDNIYLE